MKVVEKVPFNKLINKYRHSALCLHIAFEFLSMETVKILSYVTWHRVARYIIFKRKHGVNLQGCRVSKASNRQEGSACNLLLVGVLLNLVFTLKMKKIFPLRNFYWPSLDYTCYTREARKHNSYILLTITSNFIQNFSVKMFSDMTKCHQRQKPSPSNV
jgi:hypothetical protein